MFFAVIPAAGLSTRMGRPKLALPFAGQTVLEHVILTLREGGVEHIVVVTAPHSAELHSLADVAGADVHAVPHHTPDMRTTVEHGLRWFQERESPRLADAFVLVPADHPAFSAKLVRRICAAYLATQSASVVVPTYAGRRGHPTLLSWRHVAGIQSMSPECGINAYLRNCPDEILELETSEQGILLNLDRPDDYAALQRHESVSSRSRAASAATR